MSVYNVLGRRICEVEVRMNPFKLTKDVDLSSLGALTVTQYDRASAIASLAVIALRAPVPTIISYHSRDELRV